MPGLFIDIKMDAAIVSDVALIKSLIETCPVGIFGHDDAGEGVIVEDHLDECVLCDLCTDTAPPGTIEIIKLYA